MIHLILVTSGSYSDFGVCYALVGDEPFEPILNALASGMSDGRWKTWKSMEDWNWRLEQGDQQLLSIRLRDSIRNEAPKELEKHGYTNQERFELWLG